MVDSTTNGAAMRAYVLESLDVKPRLLDVPTPGLAPGQLRVRVTTSSVNPHDLHVISGSAQAYLEYRFPITLGNDLAGVVEEVGPGVTRFKPGDKVFGLLQEPAAHRGAFADYVVLPADQFLVAQPPNLADDEAGVLGLATMAALACLEPLELGEGQTVLINGATGGVGMSAIQIAAARGAHVIATARPGAEETHVRELGAAEVVDWSAGDLTAAVRTRYPAGIDAVVDLINFDADALAALARGVLRDGGHVTSTLMAVDPDRLNGANGTNVFASPRAEWLEEMAALAADGRLRGVVAEVFDLEDLEAAHAALGAGPLGKIGVRVSS
jgi:NADPH:quinone reductase-like Zn-dependent oxidoreductase